MDAGDYGGRRIKCVENLPPAAVVFLWRKQLLQVLAEGLPAGILVVARDRVRENAEGNRPEAGEAGERLLLFRGGGPRFLLDALQGADGGDDVAGFLLLAA